MKADIQCVRRRSFVQIGEHTSELQSRLHLVCRLLLGKKKRRPTEHEEHDRTRQAVAGLVASACVESRMVFLRGCLLLWLLYIVLVVFFFFFYLHAPPPPSLPPPPPPPPPRP